MPAQLPYCNFECCNFASHPSFSPSRFLASSRSSRSSRRHVVFLGFARPVSARVRWRMDLQRQCGCGKALVLLVGWVAFSSGRVASEWIASLQCVAPKRRGILWGSCPLGMLSATTCLVPSGPLTGAESNQTSETRKPTKKQQEIGEHQQECTLSIGTRTATPFTRPASFRVLFSVALKVVLVIDCAFTCSYSMLDLSAVLTTESVKTQLLHTHFHLYASLHCGVKS